jgi:hypothetical protein
MSNKIIEEPQVKESEVSSSEWCSDHDEDCEGLNYPHCWAHDPSTGLCPFIHKQN